jgi:hypothetical protein
LSRELRAERDTEARSRDHGDFASCLFDDEADDVKMFTRGQRIELAGPAGRHDRGQGVLEHHPDVLSQPVQIDGEIRPEWRDGKPDDADHRVSETVR